MKKSAFTLALGLVALGAGAQEVGNVISSVPVVQQVAVPRQVCSQPMAVQPQPTSGGGGLLGALIGAGIGSQIGGGSGRTAGLLIGTAAGAIIGNQVEANGNAQQAYAMAQPQCTTQTAYENRVVAYNVTYEYGGRQHSVQMPYDPGRTIRLQVTPMVQNDAPQPSEPLAQGGVAPGPVVVAPPIQQPGVNVVPRNAPVVIQEQQVAAPVPAPYPVANAYPAAPAPYPAYPAYPAAPYYGGYPPIGISLGFGWSNHRHR